MKFRHFTYLLLFFFFISNNISFGQNCPPIIEYAEASCEFGYPIVELWVYSPDGSNEGSYTIEWNNPPGGGLPEGPFPYGEQTVLSEIFTPDGFIYFNIVDNQDPTCSTSLEFFAPCFCEISATYTDVSCDDNGTPNDSSDDFYTVEIVVSAFQPNGQFEYIVELNDGTTQGQFYYDEPATITISPSPGDDIIFINIFDAWDLNCYTSLSITAPECTTCDIGIFSNAVANCPENSNLEEGSCEKVCANTTVTYAANTFGIDSEVVWNVQGAESYTVEGPNLIVEWGEPGSGQITASYEEEGTSNNSFTVTCDEIQPSGFGIGLGYVNVQGDTGPFEITVTTNGEPVLIYTLDGPGQIEVEGFGGYHDVLVTDNAGNTQNCQFYINFEDDTCFVGVVDSFQNESFCGNCDGWASVFQIDNAATYTYQWNTGETTDFIGNLCAGEYFVTVVDEIFGQCARVEKVTISCPLVSDTTGCMATETLCVDIIENANAMLSSTPPAVNGVISICAGQEVYFENQSENAEYFTWDFGTDESFTGNNVSFAYNDPGTYTVSLIAQNECLCSDTTQVTIEVGTDLTPDIGCTGTICSGESVSYTVDAQCGSYNWNVSNGTVTDGGGASDDFVTVDWGAGPLGIIELTVAGCTENYCPDPIVHQIPIISDATTIDGPEKVCKGDIVNYSVPDFGGTSFIWTVSGQGNIETGQGTSSITVHWNDNAPPSQQWVSVAFGNCYLECGGEETLDVNIAGEFYASGPIEVCIDEIAQYDAFKSNNNSPVDCDWSVYAPDGSLYWSSASGTNTANFNWPSTPGIYAIEAHVIDVNSFCVEKYTFFTEIIDAPAPPNSIDGETTICPGKGYSYTASSSTFTTRFKWYITNGGSNYTTEGNPVNVVWGSTPPYEISVAQISLSGLPCESETISQTVNPLGTFSIDGPDQICLEGTNTYSTTFYENLDYEWSFIPYDAGTIINGQYSENIEVLWTRPGSAQLVLNRCSDTANKTVTVNNLPTPTVNAPAGICPGEQASVNTLTPFAAYEWKDENGTVVSTDPNPSLDAGFYDLIVTDNNGCIGNMLFDIIQFPAPEVRISTPNNTGYCPGDQPPTLYGLETDEGLSYQWYRDNATIPNTSVQAVADVFGDYYLEVTDANGCITVSNTINVFEWCTPIIICTGGTCTLPSHGDFCPIMNFSANAPGDCNELDFTNNSSNAQTGSISWNFDDPNSLSNNSSTEENPTHIFSAAGFYVPYIQGNVPLLNNPSDWCPSWYAEAITVPAAAYFEVSYACPGEAAFFTDISTFIPSTNVTGWNWDFGDPASGGDNNSNNQNPEHIYQNPGDYTAILTITHEDGCTSTTERTVTVHALPSVNFVPPTLSCEQVALEFIAQSPDDISEYAWDFGDPLSGAANTATQANTFHEFSGAGLFPVSVTVTNVYGCQRSFSQTVEITPNNLSGTIDFNSPICEGETSTLLAPAGGTAWLWSDDSYNNSITVMEAGVYSVTVYDAQGCEHRPADAILDVTPAPAGTIRAIEYNEYAQPEDYHYNNYGTCLGEDVHLEVIENPAYEYAWSTGENFSEIAFSEDRDNLLSAGNHEFNVTLTDMQSGCTAVEGPFLVTIYGLPDPPIIASNPSGPVCNGEAAIISIQNPMPDHIYFWSNGALGESISTNVPGVYSVTVRNQNNCENKSNEIEIYEGPDIVKIPEGCHTRCNPDTLCMPDIPNIASWQWYLNDAPLGSPTATTSDLIIEESGDYYAVLTDNFGCTATSGTLSVDVYDAFGTIDGQVYFDENDNGIIDPGDSLMEDVFIELSDGTTVLQTASSGNNGSYAFNDIPSEGYTLSVDQSSLPPGNVPYEGTQFSVLEGCDDEEELLWLVHLSCTTVPSVETLVDCPGTMVEYHGDFYPTGDTYEVHLTTEIGCDSTVNLTVNAYEIVSTPLEFDACQGTSYDYNGNLIPAGTTENFQLVDSNGCDSLVSVTVQELLPSSNNLQIDTCGVASVFYEGIEIQLNIPTDVTLSNAVGCDSIVTVLATSSGTLTDTLLVDHCENEAFIYNNVSIEPGTQMDFPFTTVDGCDSVFTVIVNPIEVYNQNLNFSACEGETYLHDNIAILAGTQMDFPYTSVDGCDSIVTVIIAENLITYETMEIDTCMGGSFTYNGVELFPGDSETFILVNAQGCDSLLTIQVNETPNFLSEVPFEVCPGDLATYEDTTYPPGTDTTFYYVDQYGCDSVIHLTVTELPEMDYRLTSERSCWNSDDGIISVDALSGGTGPFEYSLDDQVYYNDNIFNNLLPGMYTVFVKDANGCILTQEIEVPEIEPISVIWEEPVLPCEEDSIRIAVQLTGATDTEITWDWGNGYDRNFTFVNQPGTYQLAITNECETKIENIAVALESNGQEEFIYIPNIFSPNRDGVNDFFVCAPARNVEILSFEMHLYDRWGAELFETFDYTKGWDGNYQDQDLNPGVYVYWMKANVMTCKRPMEIFRKGDVTILR